MAYWIQPLTQGVFSVSFISKTSQPGKKNGPMDIHSENWIQYSVLLHDSYRNSEPNLEVLSNCSYSQIPPNPQKSSQFMLCCLRPDPECCVILIILLLILFPIEELSCLELSGHMFSRLLREPCGFCCCLWALAS